MRRGKRIGQNEVEQARDRRRGGALWEHLPPWMEAQIPFEGASATAPACAPVQYSNAGAVCLNAVCLWWGGTFSQAW
jgi:hypothetical protein